jgi:hypothetical protein
VQSEVRVYINVLSARLAEENIGEALDELDIELGDETLMSVLNSPREDLWY